MGVIPETKLRDEYITVIAFTERYSYFVLITIPNDDL